MRKCIYVVPIATVVLFLNVFCEFPGMSHDIPDDIPDQYYYDMSTIYIRNMSTLSGVRFGYGMYSINQFTYLAPSPQPGIPVDTSIRCINSSLHWQVQRVIDCVVIDSGTISIGADKWLLIEGDSTGWSCTWSNTGW